MDILRWVENTRRAAEMGAELVVVTKADGTLGRSQKGEVSFLKNCGYHYTTRTVREFAEDVLNIFMPDRIIADGFSSYPQSKAEKRFKDCF